MKPMLQTKMCKRDYIDADGNAAGREHWIRGYGINRH